MSSRDLRDGDRENSFTERAHRPIWCYFGGETFSNDEQKLAPEADRSVGIFDLDVLRGWKEVRAGDLRDEHCLPALAMLVRTDGSSRSSFALHGPELYIGRYHPQNGPADIVLDGLADHEVYRLSAPHVRAQMSERGEWTIRPMTPAAITEINGSALTDTRRGYAISSGDTLRLGNVKFEFKSTGVTYDEFLQSKKSALIDVDATSLFLKRAGGICGPRITADADGRTIIGRSFPARDELSVGPWRAADQPDWNLAGLFEWERKYIGFRHAALEKIDDQWMIEPLSQRQRTFVNRLEISSATPLMPGDEVGLGSVLFHFHDPSDMRRSTHSHTAELPAVVNWREENTNPRVQPLANPSGTHAAQSRDGVEESSE